MDFECLTTRFDLPTAQHFARVQLVKGTQLCLSTDKKQVQANFEDKCTGSAAKKQLQLVPIGHDSQLPSPISGWGAQNGSRHMEK